MFLWEDRGSIVVLVEFEGQKLDEHKLLKDYRHISIEKGNVVCELADDILEEEFEVIEYKVSDDDMDSWKVKGLQRFCYFLKRKGIDINFSHGILTQTINLFTNRNERELIIINLEEDAEYEGFLNPSFDERYNIIVSQEEGIAFIEVEKQERFISSEESVIDAVSECLSWYESNKPCQAIELLNTAMIAERFGKQRQNVHRYFKEGKLPTPYAFADGTPYWHKKQLYDLAQALKVDIDEE